MVLNIFKTIAQLPMVWDFIIPLGIIAIFCFVLFYEGEWGGNIRRKKNPHPKH